MTPREIIFRSRVPQTSKLTILKQLAVASAAVVATATFGMTAPAATATPVTTKDLAPIATCMTPHQAWVWEKAVLSVPAIVLVPPHICP